MRVERIKKATAVLTLAMMISAVPVFAAEGDYVVTGSGAIISRSAGMISSNDPYNSRRFITGPEKVSASGITSGSYSGPDTGTRETEQKKVTVVHADSGAAPGDFYTPSASENTSASGITRGSYSGPVTGSVKSNRGTTSNTTGVHAVPGVSSASGTGSQQP